MALLKTRKKSVALIAAAGLTVAGTGVAFAYWTAQGDGVGAATTGEVTAFEITSEAPDGPDLAPGSDPGQTIDFTVTNPGTGNQLLSAVNVRVANADGSTWLAVPGCSAADYSVGITSVSTPLPTVVAPAGTVTGVATITMNNLGTNQDACQDVTVPLYFETNVPV